MDDLIEFLTARYDELERTAKDRLCISCGHPTKERYVEGLFGIREWRGYEHDERRDSTGRMHRWQGVRCEGGMTGAEPVQRPDLVLTDLAAKRATLRYLQRVREVILDANLWTLEDPVETLKLAAQQYADHPDFKAKWRIDA